MPRTPSRTHLRRIERGSHVHVQRHPLRLGRVRQFTLPLTRLCPVIRIAHRNQGVLKIRPRMIVDHELVLMLRGEAGFVFGEKIVPLAAGMMMLIPPFVEHAIDSDAPSEHVAIHFDLSPSVPGTRAAARSGAYAVAFSQGQSLPTCRPLLVDTLAREQVLRVTEVFASDSAAGAMECSGLMSALVCGMLSADVAQTPSPHAARLRRLIAHIDAKLHLPIESGEMAEVAGLSTSRLRAVFVQSFGIPPHQYLLQRRIARARQLLGEDHLSLKQIARACGFADEFHFSKAFRRIDGLPPSVYRLQAQASRF